MAHGQHTQRWQYTRGLHDIGNSVYAYLQPDGTWGWSNAGLITDGEASLLVDTLYDLKLTQEMLDTMCRAVPAASHIDIVVNSHANGDHCNGNQLVADARIIASKRTSDELREGITPAQMAMLLQQAPAMGKTGKYFSRIFGPFEFGNITPVYPQETFEGELALKVGDKEVRLIEVGPAHTQGDTIVYVPGDRVVFTADILFIGGHPIIWVGPTANWIRACDRILALDVDVIVPGHGPITDKQGVTQIKDYLQYIYNEARQRYDAGMSSLEAARDIRMDRYATWTDGERLAVNIDTIYREFSGDTSPRNTAYLFGQMAELAEEV